jgi:hypothetical protein
MEYYHQQKRTKILAVEQIGPYFKIEFLKSYS